MPFTREVKYEERGAGFFQLMYAEHVKNELGVIINRWSPLDTARKTLFKNTERSVDWNDISIEGFDEYYQFIPRYAALQIAMYKMLPDVRHVYMPDLNKEATLLYVLAFDKRRGEWQILSDGTILHEQDSSHFAPTVPVPICMRVDGENEITWTKNLTQEMEMGIDAAPQISNYAKSFLFPLQVNIDTAIAMSCDTPLNMIIQGSMTDIVGSLTLGGLLSIASASRMVPQSVLWETYKNPFYVPFRAMIETATTAFVHDKFSEIIIANEDSEIMQTTLREVLIWDSDKTAVAG